MQFAIINTDTGLVENLVDYDKQPDNPPSGLGANYIAVPNQGANPGWAYENGIFTNPNPPTVTEPPTIIQQIIALEATQTPRRIRDFATGKDNGWLANLEDQIAALRSQLK